MQWEHHGCSAAPSRGKKAWALKEEQEFERVDGKNFYGKETPLGLKRVRGTSHSPVWQDMSLLGRRAGVRLGQALKDRTLRG